MAGSAHTLAWIVALGVGVSIDRASIDRAMIARADAPTTTASPTTGPSDSDVVLKIEKPVPPELPPPPMWKGDQVDVVEKLGQRVPLDAKFRTHDGALVTLGEVLAGELPTILTFNYSDCPMLCSLQLNGFTAALPGVMAKGTVEGAAKPVAFAIGKQFRIVTISLEPNEQLPRIQKMRDKYLERTIGTSGSGATAKSVTGSADGWTFLVAAEPGDATQIQRVAESVGFKYTYLEKKAEWAHPAALIFLSTKGAVTRYVYGIEFPADVLRESIFKAGLAEPSTASGFMHRCYNYDPDENNHSRAGVLALRIGAAGFLVLFMGGMGFFLLRRARSPRRVATDQSLSRPL